MEKGKKYYYVDSSSGEVLGPNSLEELKDFQIQNRISGETQVAEEGKENWMSLEKLLQSGVEVKDPGIGKSPVEAPVPKAVVLKSPEGQSVRSPVDEAGYENHPVPDEAKKISREAEAITAILIDKLLDFLRRGYLSELFAKNERWLTTAGLVGLYIAALLGLFSSIILPIRYDVIPFGISLGSGIAWFFLCIVIHYVAWKFLPVLTHIIQTTPTKLSSKAFLDSLALMAGIAGVIAIGVGFYLWAETAVFAFLIWGIAVFIFCEYMLSLCLNPKNLNIEISEQTSVGEEFLGLISFFMKSFLKLVPIIFGSGIIWIILNIFNLLFSPTGDFLGVVGNDLMLVAQLSTLMVVGLLPLTAYFCFLSYYFVIDLAMAVLAVPSKLDRLDKQN